MVALSKAISPSNAQLQWSPNLCLTYSCQLNSVTGYFAWRPFWLDSSNEGLQASQNNIPAPQIFSLNRSLGISLWNWSLQVQGQTFRWALLYCVLDSMRNLLGNVGFDIFEMTTCRVQNSLLVEQKGEIDLSLHRKILLKRSQYLNVKLTANWRWTDA